MGNSFTSEQFNFSNIKSSLCYPTTGLNHSLEELEIMNKYIHYLPVHIQEKYADKVVIENSQNVKWLKEQFSDLNQHSFVNLNTTAVGNMAYLSLHAPIEELRIYIGDYLQQYCVKRQSLDVQLINEVENKVNVNIDVNNIDN